jgi:oligopeptide transport system permease protein
MLRFIFGRLLQMIPVLLVIATLTFFMIRLAPGGPFDAEKSVSPEIRKSLERYYKMVNPDGSRAASGSSSAITSAISPAAISAHRRSIPAAR